MSRILITGANGFIGRAIAETLALSNIHTVRAAIRKYKSDFHSPVDLFQSLEMAGSTDWTDALKNIEVVIHCAARAHVICDASKNPLDDFRKVNVDGTLNLAKQAAASGVKRFIFLSSIGVHGEKTLQTPFKPDDILRPSSHYAQTKMEAELGLIEISRTSLMSTIIIRPPLVYGSYAPGNFGSLLRMIKKRVPLPFGAVKNKRSFIFLDNLVHMIICCITHPNAENQIFLVSDDEDLSTTLLLKKMQKGFKKSSFLLPIPAYILKAVALLLGKADIAQKLLGSLQVDIQKTKLILDWRPQYSVEQAMRKMAKDAPEK